MTAPWSTIAPLDRLVAIASGLTGIQAVVVGIPSSPPSRVYIYITGGGQVPMNKAAGGLIQRSQSYRVVLCYVIEDAEGTAETTILAAVDAFMDAVFADQTLNGTLESVQIDASEADQPRYAGWTGGDIREYPIRVSGTQRKTYPVH